MYINDIIEKINDSNNLISMAPLDKIIELGYVLGFNEKTRILDLCCGYGTMLKILCQAYNISGKGIDISKEFIENGLEIIKKAGITDKIILECNDIKKCKEKNYDVVILTEPYLFGNIEESINELEKYIKPYGKIIIGTIIVSEDSIPQELIDFDGDNLHTEMELYDIFLKKNYAISYIGRSTQGEWDRYFTWSSRRIVKDIRNIKIEQEKIKQMAWLEKWYKMYSKYRIKYEKWCLYAIEKINI